MKSEVTPEEVRALPDDYKFPGHQYSLGEMREMIRKMRAVNKAFYPQAVATGCHTFIEFCGLQAKFIDMCEQAMLQGVEFPFANAHTGLNWPIPEHHAKYLGEKFECIWGFTIGADPDLRRAFEKAAFEKH